MAELQLESLAAERDAAQLMAQANPKNRHAAQQLLDILHGKGDRLGIAGPVRQKNTVGSHCQNIFGQRGRWDYRDGAPMINEHAQNVLLDAEIVGNDFEASFAGIFPAARALLMGRLRVIRREWNRAALPVILLRASHLTRKFVPRHRRQRARFGDQSFGRRCVG